MSGDGVLVLRTSDSCCRNWSGEGSHKFLEQVPPSTVSSREIMAPKRRFLRWNYCRLLSLVRLSLSWRGVWRRFSAVPPSLTSLGGMGVSTPSFLKHPWARSWHGRGGSRSSFLRHPWARSLRCRIRSPNCTSHSQVERSIQGRRSR